MSSFPKNFDDFQYLIQSRNIAFDGIAILESRIIKNKQSIVDMNAGYSNEFCPTEWSVGDTQRNHLSYKLRRDLSVYKLCKLEINFH